MDLPTITSARAHLPPNSIYADWATSALPLPLPPPTFLPPSHTPSHPTLSAARAALRTFLHDPDHHYHIIFTSNATTALHLLSTRLPWHRHSTLLTHAHSHNAILGLRNPALAAGAAFRSLPTAALHHSLSRAHAHPPAAPPTPPFHTPPPFALLAFPAECNLTGARFPLTWATLAKTNGLPDHPPAALVTLVDTTKLIASHPCSLRDNPDIDALVFSAYKLSGSLTGLGALLIRKRSYLERLLVHTAGASYFGGGRSVQVVTPFSPVLFVPSADLEGALQLGTPNLQGLHALPMTLEVFQKCEGGMQGVSRHVRHVAEVFREGLRAAFERVVVHGDAGLREIGEGGWEGEGGVVTFTVLREVGDGEWRAVGHTEVGRVLEMNGVYARVGCMCNAGGCAEVLGLGDAEVGRNYARGVRCGEGGDFVDGKGTGVVRVSFGWGSVVEDAVGVVKVVKEFVCVRVGRGVGAGGGEGRVSEVWVYPVKGCGGSRVTRAAVGKGGLAGDRGYAVVGMGGGMVTVREARELAGVRAGWRGGGVEMWEEGGGARVGVGDGGGGGEWVSRVVGQAVWVRKLERDSGNVLVIWENEVEWVGRESGVSKEGVVRAMRANVVMKGWGAGAARLVGERVAMVKVRDCTRCGVVNLIAEWGGEGGAGEPLRSVVKLRRSEGKGGVVFGCVYEVVGEGGEVRVGDVFRAAP